MLIAWLLGSLVTEERYKYTCFPPLRRDFLSTRKTKSKPISITNKLYTFLVPQTPVTNPKQTCLQTAPALLAQAVLAARAALAASTSNHLTYLEPNLQLLSTSSSFMNRWTLEVNKSTEAACGNGLAR